MSDQDHISDLIYKYLSGNATDAEVKVLEDWVLASAENKTYFTQAKKAWMLSGMTKPLSGIDPEADLKKIQGPLFTPQKTIERKINRHRFWRLGIAASILIVLAASLWLFFSQPQSESIATQDKIEQITLPDGSAVVLNQFATLDYQIHESASQRLIKLDGDAFFEVADDETKPFIIASEFVEVEVVGTSFYVDARKEQPLVQVIVESGTVIVRSPSRQDTLNAGEQITFVKSEQQVLREPTTDQNYLAIKTNQLTFSNTPLSTVVFDLNRQFHANIEIGNNDLMDCPITTKFNQMSLEAIITVLENTFGITSKIENDRIVLEGNCQNPN